jgi:Ran GTPase-activating protein (RanGAP) involved in mRNA processing and transport
MRSCLFLGESAFAEITNGLQYIPQLKTLNLSYCSLGDTDIIPLVRSVRYHSNIECVHLGGNFCHTPKSVDVIADWINDPACKLRDINLRGLWVGFNQGGLLQRFVNLAPVFYALGNNSSIHDLTMSENYLEDNEVRQLVDALLSNLPKRKLQYLDVGDNPFEENGAKALENLVRRVKTLRAIRFENHFMTYQCSELVKLLAEFNHYDKLLVKNPVDVSLSVWPHAFARIQDFVTENNLQSDRTAPNHLFRLLRSSTGPYGHELSLRIAMSRN